MILEALEWCATPCPWFARRRGLLAAQIGIRHRANRCRTSWKPHLDACRRFFANAVGPGPREETLVILGSGHLNDFDVPFLFSRFEQITLVDAVHPLEIQIRAKFSNGRLNPVTADLCEPSKPVADLVATSNWTVSSCLLSQLPLFAGRTESRDILSRHLELLATAPRSILITDVAKRMAEKSEWTSLLGDTSLPECDAAWIWTIAPPGENGPSAEERLVRACGNIPPGLVFEIDARQGEDFQK